MQLITATLVLALAAASSALFFGKKEPTKWDALSVTWGPLPIKNYYDKLPQTEEDAVADGWTKVNSACEGSFSGFRYIKKGDTSMSVLYNVNGVISGIQMNPKADELAAKENDYKFDQVSMFQKTNTQDDITYTLTAYFAEPSTICDPTTARTQEALEKEGFGKQLFFQDGTTSADNYEAPNNRGVALKTGWNNNNCFPGMGWHTWYKSEELKTVNCTVDRPVFLLFNKQQELIGFGFNVVGTANSPSERYEHPPLLAVKTIMGNPPQCLIDRQKKVGLTTMHVFFVPYSEIPKVDCVNPF